MQTINLNNLPLQARLELLDFYEFLLTKYSPTKDVHNISNNKNETQPRLGELAIHLFGTAYGIEINLPPHIPHEPLKFE